MKAAIFDMDGTLLDSMKMWRKALPTFLNSLNVPLDKEFMDATHSMSMEEMVDYAISYYHLPINARDLKDHWRNIMLKSYKEEAKPKPYAVEYLEKLKSEGVRIALATLTEHFLSDEVVKEFGLSKYFDYHLTTQDVNYVKKDKPDIYLKCASLMGAKPEECVVFEDSLYPLDGVLSAGFTLYVIEEEVMADCRDELKKKAHRYIKSYKELL